MSNETEIFVLLDGVTANCQSYTALIPGRPLTVEAFITGTDQVDAIVTFYGCNTNRTTNGLVFATSTLSSASGGDVTSEICAAAYPFIYCILTSLSGTDAAVTASVSV